MNIQSDRHELLKVFFENVHLFGLNILYLIELAIISGNVYDGIITASLSHKFAKELLIYNK